MKAKVLEIFQSIQGEGKYAGVRQVFVRFFGCNMHCVWCDTPHSIGDTSQRFDEYDVEALTSNIQSQYNDCHSVSITGGEPLLQKDVLKKLLPRLKKSRLTTYLETNGIYHKELGEVLDDVDIIAMDIKLPSSTECDAYWREHEEFLKVAKNKDTFIKTVISSKTDKSDIHKSIDLVAGIDPSIPFILQPNAFDMQNGVVQKCQEFQMECLKKLKDVRIIPQMHRLLKLR